MKHKNTNGQNILPMRVQDFPAALRAVLNGVKEDEWQQRYLLGALPCLAAYADRIRAKYPYGEETHAANLYTLVVGHQASGKSYIRRIVAALMTPFKNVSDEERRKEDLFREEKRNRKKSELSAEPHPCIRELSSSVTQAAIQMYAANMKRRYGDFLSFFYLNEEATLIARGNGTPFSNMREVMRLGFDYGSEFGNSRAHADCISSLVQVRMNALLATTYSGLNELFPRSEVDQGSVSRYMLVKIDDAIDAPPAETRPIGEEEKQAIQKVLNCLMEETITPSGELHEEIWLDMSWLFPDIHKWNGAAREKAAELGSQSYKSLSNRASVMGFRGAMLLYYLYHIDNQLFQTRNRTEAWIRKRVKKFYHWLATYALESNFDFWGGEMDDLMIRYSRGRRPESKLFRALPQEFSAEMLQSKQEELGQKTDVKVRVSQWKAKGLILETSKFHYQKIMRA